MWLQAERNSNGEVFHLRNITFSFKFALGLYLDLLWGGEGGNTSSLIGSWLQGKDLHGMIYDL